ncbi:MAG: hypothetical protein IGR76_12455 [Synechococcales cyanobacterium T60_A2020_003]|nr:hypothetical protein [Synechococcales cyanobacterium T60_A2020_003]
MTIFFLLLFCFGLVVLAAYGLSWRMNRLNSLRSHSIVAVQGVEARYPNLPLQQYGIASRLNSSSGRVQVLFPKLTERGDVEYLFSWHYIRDVTPVDPDAMPLDAFRRDSTLHTACEVLPVIRDHLEFEQDALHLNEQLRRLDRLADLVATSSFYGDQVEIYERAIAEVDTALLKARDLHKLYVRLVREALIGVQIAGYDPSNIRSDRLTFELEHQRLREEYRHLKDLTAAYTDLMLGDRADLDAHPAASNPNSEDETSPNFPPDETQDDR